MVKDVKGSSRQAMRLFVLAVFAALALLARQRAFTAPQIRPEATLSLHIVALLRPQGELASQG